MARSSRTHLGKKKGVSPQSTGSSAATASSSSSSSATATTTSTSTSRERESTKRRTVMGSSSSSSSSEKSGVDDASIVSSVRVLRKLNSKELRARLEMLEHESERSIRAFEAQLGVGAENAQALREEVHRLRALVVSLERNAEDRVNVGKMQGQEQETKLKASESLSQQLARELEVVKKELSEQKARENEREDLLKETTDALYEWKDAYEALEGENVEMEKEIEALGAELDEVSKGGPGSSASGGPARKEVRQLQQALAAVQSELEQAKAALAEQISDKDEVERLADKAEALGLEINTFKQELRDSKSESEGYRQGFSLYQGLYLEAAQKIDKLASEVNSFKSQCRETGQQLEIRTMVADSLRQEYLRVESLRASAESELEEMKEDTSLLSEWSRGILRSMSKL